MEILLFLLLAALIVFIVMYIKAHSELLATRAQLAKTGEVLNNEVNVAEQIKKHFAAYQVTTEETAKNYHEAYKNWRELEAANEQLKFSISNIQSALKEALINNATLKLKVDAQPISAKSVEEYIEVGVGYADLESGNVYFAAVGTPAIRKKAKDNGYPIKTLYVIK